MYSIVIPFFNRWDLVHNRLFDLYKNIPTGDAEILLINDASTDDDVDGGVAWWQKKWKDANNALKIKYFKNKENLGFGGSMNKGIKYVEGNRVVLLSNDVIVSGNFLSNLNQLFDTNGDRILIGAEIVHWASGWNNFQTDRGEVIVPYCNGWFLCATKEVFTEIGGFDPIYGKFDYEDVDLSASAQKHGIKLVEMQSKGILKHLGSQTVSKVTQNRAEHTIRNQQLFYEKWKAYLNGENENV